MLNIALPFLIFSFFHFQEARLLSNIFATYSIDKYCNFINVFYLFFTKNKFSKYGTMNFIRNNFIITVISQTKKKESNKKF